MCDKYLVEGKVDRAKIAMDIKYQELKRDEIEMLLKDPRIKDSFIGTGYNDKKPQSEWSKDYLNILSYAAVAESFNRDYLLYLDSVADYVIKIKQKKILIAGSILILIVVVIAGVMYITTTKSTASSLSKNNIERLIRKYYW